MTSGGSTKLKLAGLAVLVVAALAVVGFALFRPITPDAALAPVTASKSSAPILTPAPVVPLAAFIGDSYSAGSGADDPLLRWTSLASQKLDWVENNFALAGTGYVNEGKPGTCGKPACPNYAGVVADVVSANPAFVVISGGRNDVWYTTDDIKAHVTALVTQIRAQLPKAKLVITSPLWDARPVPADMASVIEAVKEAAAATGTPYADLGEPLAGHPELIFTDGVHPNVAGHAAISAAATNAIKAALKL